MPILRINSHPFYITISELIKLPVLERLIKYTDNEMINQPFSETEKQILTEFVDYNNRFDREYKHQFVNLIGYEAKCACTELILYYIYFFCNKTHVLKYFRSSVTDNSLITLNDLYYPYASWKIEYIIDGLTLKSGDLFYLIDLSYVERVVGFFQNFKVILKDIILTFQFGRIDFEIRNKRSDTNIEKFYVVWNEYSGLFRNFNSIDRRNYSSFAFYLNDYFIYSDYYHPRFYQSFDSYKKTNQNLFESC